MKKGHFKCKYNWGNSEYFLQEIDLPESKALESNLKFNYFLYNEVEYIHFKFNYKISSKSLWTISHFPQSLSVLFASTLSHYPTNTLLSTLFLSNTPPSTTPSRSTSLTLFSLYPWTTSRFIYPLFISFYFYTIIQPFFFKLFSHKFSSISSAKH